MAADWTVRDDLKRGARNLAPAAVTGVDGTPEARQLGAEISALLDVIDEFVAEGGTLAALGLQLSEIGSQEPER